MGWFSRWWAAKTAGAAPAMSRQAALKREQVLAVVPELNQFMQLTRQHVLEDDLKIPRRFQYFIAYALGAMQALGEPQGFEEGQLLAGLLIYLEQNLALTPQGISETLGRCMAMREEAEGQEAMQAGAEALRAWQQGDLTAAKRLAVIFDAWSGPFGSGLKQA